MRLPKTTVTDKQTASFSRFQDLPPELRHEIWRLAALDPPPRYQQPHGICILDCDAESIRDLYAPTRLQAGRPRPKVHCLRPNTNPALFLVSTEAYEIVSSIPPHQFVRDYIPHRDIMYSSTLTALVSRLPASAIWLFTSGQLIEKKAGGAIPSPFSLVRLLRACLPYCHAL
jgi:hypothetical protein